MEDSTDMEPCSLQIINSSPDMIITLNEDALKSVLTRDEIKDKYISVISITGTFRQGKSFLLNFLLRYLRIKYVENKDVTDWLTPDHGSLQGFPYSPGYKRYTVGIHMWSEIFIAKLPTGEEVAIILLDTQGSFDNQSSMDDCAKIFALSTLISSVQIYNVMRTIKQYDLAHLQCFGGYGTLMSSEESTRPFQNLCFLVRDWAFPYEQQYGSDGGAAILEEIFGSDNSEVKGQVDNIKSLFDKIDCFLLPYPGRIVDTSNSFNIHLDDMDEDFKKYVQDFVTMLLSPERLILKTVNGVSLKAEELIYYIQEYTNSFKDPDLLKVETIFKATVEAQHKSAFSKALQFYKGIMDALVTNNPRRSTADELNEKHVSNKMKAVNYYTKFKKIDDEGIFDKFLGNLEDTIDEEYKRYMAINEEKQNEQDREKHNSGSTNHQQFMLDHLGDRDYDSFDRNELECLREKIGFALYGPPKKENGYENEEKEKTNSLFEIIVEQNNSFTKWKDRVIISFIYTCIEPLPHEKDKRVKTDQDYDPKKDFTPLPVFVLRKCKKGENSCRVFIDHTGRVYSTWEEYLSDNKLPKCEMIYPKNGRYQADDEGNVILESRLSPACDITNDILLGTDIASAIGGIASGGAMVAATAIPAVAAAPLVVPAAIVTGAAIGVYSLVRSSLTLHDRGKHKESINPVKSSEARSAYINIAAGALGFIGAGANMALSTLAAKGFSIEQGAVSAVNTMNIINIGAGGVGIANASYDVIRNWIVEDEPPSLLTIVQLSSSILFFGHAVYNYRSLSSIIEDSQAKTLKDYSESLRSNRHRKAFTKLVKETIRQNNGNVQKGQAEVISTLKNIQNRDEVFATLVKSNKAMNKNNVRFAAQNGEITLNGVKVDMASFSSMDKSDVITFLTRLPNKPNPSAADVRNMTTYLQNSFRGVQVTDIASLAVNVLRMFGSTDSTIKEKIINAVSQFVTTLIKNHTNYMSELDRIFPNRDKYSILLNMVNGFFQKMVNEFEEKYFKWLETQDPEDEEPCFMGFLSLDATRRITKMFNIVTRVYFVGTNLTENGLKELLNYFWTWFACQVYFFEDRERRKELRHSVEKAVKVNCEVCGGYFYSPQT